jgi:hypothetical protein
MLLNNSAAVSRQEKIVDGNVIYFAMILVHVEAALTTFFNFKISAKAALTIS